MLGCQPDTQIAAVRAKLTPMGDPNNVDPTFRTETLTRSIAKVNGRWGAVIEGPQLNGAYLFFDRETLTNLIRDLDAEADSHESPRQ